MNILAAIHVGKKQLGLDEETYRAMLKRVTGKSSAKDMSEDERESVVAEMRRQGFKPFLRGDKKEFTGRSRPSQKQRSGLYRKLQALWIAGYNLGLVHDRRDSALDKFIRDKCGGRKVQAVEALKGWLARDAGVMWGSPHHKCDKERVVVAQWLMMCGLSADYHPGGFMAALRAVTNKPYSALKDDDWHQVMAAWGKRLRGLKGLK